MIKHMIFQFPKIPFIKNIWQRTKIISCYLAVLRKIDIQRNPYINGIMCKEVEQFQKNALINLFYM